MFTSSMINGEAAPGLSSGYAIRAATALHLPRGYQLEWSEVTGAEIKSGNQTLLISLVCLFRVYVAGGTINFLKIP